MSYTHTFIQVAADCPVTSSIVPVAKGDTKPIHVLQYELLTARPYHYHYTHEELLFEVYIHHKAISQAELALHRDELWEVLLQKNHPCLRASLLPKKYGWGVHYDHAGKIAIYPMESADYQAFSQPTGDTPKQLMALRSKRA